MQPLIDGDIYQYEIGFAAEASWAAKGGEGDPPFYVAEEILDNKLAHMLATIEATEPPIFYFTAPNNFRFNIAKTAPYKNRPGRKPILYKQIKHYLQAGFECIEQEGLEADDLIAIALTQDPEGSICCSRDKDLRQVEGWHYGWEVNNQPQFGPLKVEGFGELMLSSKGKLTGFGEKFFWSQMLTGDNVDTIPGCIGIGAVGAFKILQATQCREEALKAVVEAYKASYGLYWNEVMLEQGQLLHMIRELDAEGTPVMWSFDYV